MPIADRARACAFGRFRPVSLSTSSASRNIFQALKLNLQKGYSFVCHERFLPRATAALRNTAASCTPAWRAVPDVRYTSKIVSNPASPLTWRPCIYDIAAGVFGHKRRTFTSGSLPVIYPPEHEPVCDSH